MRTQEEIAKTLNVSTATVSRALNGKPGVSSATREKIFELAEKMLAKPQTLVQRFDGSRSYAVAFVVKRHLIWSDNPFYERIMMGAEEELERQGYHLVAITIDEDLHSEHALPPGLDLRRLDGLLIAGPELSHRMVKHLLSLGAPSVLVGNSVPNVTANEVSSQNVQGGYAATRHLIEHGHQRIAYLSGPADAAPVRERKEGYLEAMREFDLESRIVVQPGLSIIHGVQGMKELLDQLGDTTAVFAANDPVAIGAMQAAKEAGRAIPGDLAIVGFDNLAWTESTDPPLTTVYIHKRQMGRLAARRLLDIMQDESEHSIKILVENELVIRKSCGCS